MGRTQWEGWQSGRGMAGVGRGRGRDPRVGVVVGKTQMGRREVGILVIVHSGADIRIFQVYTMFNGL